MFKTIEQPADCGIRSLIRFLNTWNVSAADIRRQISEVYGSTPMSDSKDGLENVRDEPRSGRPSLITQDLFNAVEEKIREDRHNGNNRTKRTPMCDVVAETDSAGYDSEAGVDSKGRRLSGELISMKDFLTSNKVSLAVMQKQLYETAMMQRGYGDDRTAGRFTPGTVGPLAIVTQKLGDSSGGR